MRSARRHSIVVTVALPYPEAWSQMTPTAQGRHCAAGAQEVVDFTRYTDAELLAWFRQPARGATCGRFRLDQLARPLRHQLPRRRGWLAVLGAFGLWLGVALPTLARQLPLPLLARPVVLQRPVTPFRGRVLNPHSHQPQPGILVQLVGADVRAYTDSNGYFALTPPTPLPPSGRPWHLRFTGPHYAPLQLPAHTPAAQLVSLQLAPARSLLQGIRCGPGYHL